MPWYSSKSTTYCNPSFETGEFSLFLQRKFRKNVKPQTLPRQNWMGQDAPSLCCHNTILFHHHNRYLEPPPVDWSTNNTLFKHYLQHEREFDCFSIKKHSCSTCRGTVAREVWRWHSVISSTKPLIAFTSSKAFTLRCQFNNKVIQRNSNCCDS